ncbi:glycosyl hydrolase [Altererythrobacter salegens]|uniref:Glycosyl hydrolase n=1 Tax=Croceibacterium salegens TaxID=1737568 RepID=A0A6I4SWZ7_9SPHN|nr:glycoside hydrolase family 88 protein [Croceibacterium salegens]MXO58882.1 glycosyl hydrolase [Croceibacterium salegens]
MRRLSSAELSRRSLLGTMGMLALGGCVSGVRPSASPDPAVLSVGKTAALEWGSRPDVVLYEIPDVVAPHYAEAGVALGVSRLSANLSDPSLLDIVRTRWAKAALMPNSANHVDANVIGTWAMLADDEQRGIELADGQWAETGDDGLTKQARYWIDDVWMIGALQTQAFRSTGMKRFIDRSALMAVRYLERLQQPNWLFHHGLTAPFFWARGNGWVAAGLAEILSILPREHQHWPTISAGFERTMEALLRTQRADGLWGQLIDHPEAWTESSGSAMFAYAFVRASNAGFLSAAPYRTAAQHAWEGLCDRVEPDGKLRGVCVGTGQADNAQFYFDRPTVTGDLHGQAPLLWLCAELAA